VKILLLGANGQLGRTFLRHGGLAKRGTVLAASRDGAVTEGGKGIVGDLTEIEELIDTLDREEPDLIVNAAAYTAVDRAEDDEDTATRVNGVAVGEIGRWAERHGVLIVHYSTDYVFAGDATSPYPDDAAIAPAGAYGRSKAAGEKALRDSKAPHFIFRTAWVYAPVGNNFLRTMLRLGADRDELRVVADQLGTPTDTTLIVEGSLAAIDRWIARPDERRTVEGTYHLTASGSTSWHGFAKSVFEGAAARGLLYRAPVVHPIGTVDFPTPARRPAYSVLDNRRFAQTFAFDLPEWQVGVDRTLNALSPPSD
jgi:dTDP-4-dehydrorhamnose reductase